MKHRMKKSLGFSSYASKHEILPQEFQRPRFTLGLLMDDESSVSRYSKEQAADAQSTHHRPAHSDTEAVQGRGGIIKRDLASV